MQPNNQNVTRGIALFLGLITLLLFLPLGKFDFVNYDDDLHVTQNEIVKEGLTVKGLVWAFTGSSDIFWHPITWMSHMLDVSLFGLNPSGHHIMSLLIHLAAAMILFYALLEMTDRPWPSGIVAAWFAWHPLHVESVAWIAERKDVLSGFFFALILLAYAHYVKSKDRRWYWLTFAALVLGLMSKTMLVTVPLVLLLLDIWPLKRVSIGGKLDLVEWRKLFWEKWPFYAIMIIAVLLTLVPAILGSAVRSEEQWGFDFRAKNAMVSILRYLELTFYPRGLAVYYPPADIPAAQAMMAAILVTGLGAWCFVQRKQSPFWLIGFAWFIIMLLPVLGLVKVGTHAFADRYTYLPLIGIFTAIAFGADGWVRANVGHRKIVAGIAGVSLVACIVLTKQQLMVWQNSITLFQHALKVTRDNPIAHYNLAAELMQQDRPTEALPHYEAVLKLRPNREDVHLNYGLALLKTKKIVEAREHFITAIELNPANVEARMNLGNIFYLEEKRNESLEQFRQVLRLRPDHSGARNNLGLILLDQGRLNEAEANFREAIQRQPENSEAHFNLGRALVRLGRVEEGTVEWMKAAQLSPDASDALIHLTWLLATHPEARYRKGPEAVKLGARVLQITGPNDLVALDALAAAHAECGQFAEAINIIKRALEISRAAGDTLLLETMEKHLKSYQEGKPWRQAP
ncbi:MAG TPA: tetratricopeptide repeat protein [Verrucomicrobiae bacterium]